MMVWSSVLEVKSSVLIERGVKKSRSGAPCLRSKSGILIARDMKVWSPVLEIKSSILIERGVKKSRSGAPCLWSKVLF